jgi:hypothetical protein
MRVGPYPPLARIPRSLNHVCGAGLPEFFLFGREGFAGAAGGGGPGALQGFLLPVPQRMEKMTAGPCRRAYSMARGEGLSTASARAHVPSFGSALLQHRRSRACMPMPIAVDERPASPALLFLLM